MGGDVDVAAAAALIGEPARAALLIALTEAEYLPAGEVAARAGIAPSTASGHLARLLEGRLIVAQRSGRHRYLRLANAEVAQAIEALSAIAPQRCSFRGQIKRGEGGMRVVPRRSGRTNATSSR